jgi:hypothetical protein
MGGASGTDHGTHGVDGTQPDEALDREARNRPDAERAGLR